MKTIFYLLLALLLGVWGWVVLGNHAQQVRGHGLHVVVSRAPRLRLWSAARARIRRARTNPDIPRLPIVTAVAPAKTVILERSKNGVTRVLAQRSTPRPAVAASTNTSHRQAGTRAERVRTSRSVSNTVQCWRVTTIIHYRWAHHLAEAFGVPIQDIARRLVDVHLFRLALILPRAKAAVTMEQRLHGAGFPRPYFRHHGGEPELSLGVFLTRRATLPLERRLLAAGFHPVVESFVRPWTTWEITLHARHALRRLRKMRYPGTRLRACSAGQGSH